MYILKIMTEGPRPMLLPVASAPTFPRKSAALAWLVDHCEQGTEFSVDTDATNDALDIMVFDKAKMTQYAVEKPDAGR